MNNNPVIYQWDDLCTALGRIPTRHDGMLIRNDYDHSPILKIPEDTAVIDAVSIMPFFDEIWVTRESGLETCIKCRWHPVQNARLFSGDGLFH